MAFWKDVRKLVRKGVGLAHISVIRGTYWTIAD